MAFTVREFDDLLRILESQPEWRVRLRRALFPEIDVAKALQDLAEAQQRTEAGLQRLEELMANLALGQDQLIRRVDSLEQKVDQLDKKVDHLDKKVDHLDKKVDHLDKKVDHLDKKVDHLDRDVGKLKGKAQEDYYRTRASGIFGGFLRNGREAVNRVADQLYAALREQRITAQELQEVLAADLLWSGEDRQTHRRAILVMEASWLAEEGDVVRAHERATVLRRIGLPALAVVGGDEWTTDALRAAETLSVIRTRAGQVDLASWQAAWLQNQPPGANGAIHS